MLCAKTSGTARGQTLLVARRKCMAKSCFRVKKRGILEIDQYFFAVVLSQTWGMLICGKCKLLSI